MFVPRYLTAEEVERLATIFLREVETALVKEHLSEAAKAVTGPDLVVEAHHGEPVVAAVEAERDRLLQRQLPAEPPAAPPAPPDPPAGADPLAAMAAVLKAEQEEAQAAQAAAADKTEEP